MELGLEGVGVALGLEGGGVCPQAATENNATTMAIRMVVFPFGKMWV
jgi:hypothetical protein